MKKLVTIFALSFAGAVTLGTSRETACPIDVEISFRLYPPDSTKTDLMIQGKLSHAEKTAAQLFLEVEKMNLLVAGKTERQLNDEVTRLAKEKFGIEKHWHKKIVRSGPNTVSIYPDNPPDRVIQPDDILFLDFGGVVQGYEFDYARTYVLGTDPRKIKLKNDVIKAWYEIRDWVRLQNHVKASDLFQLTRAKSKEYGWASAGEIAGHIVGEFPHEQPADPKSLELDVHPANPDDIFLRDANGLKRHWILEVHFVDREQQIGAYFEQLL